MNPNGGALIPLVLLIGMRLCVNRLETVFGEVVVGLNDGADCARLNHEVAKAPVQADAEARVEDMGRMVEVV